MPDKALRKLSIHGFKSIRTLDDMELGALNVLIGANGSGKSNFIAFFRLLNQMVEGRLQNFVAESSLSNLLYYGPKVTRNIEFKLDFGQNRYAATLSMSDMGNLVFTSEDAWLLSGIDEDVRYVPLGLGHSETALSTNDKPTARYVMNALKSWRLYHFHDTSVSTAVKQTGDIHNNARLASDAGNLAAFLYTLQNSQYRPYYDRIVETVRLIAPFFDGFELRPEVANADLIRLRWRDSGSADAFDVSTLSDGTLRFICLVTLLLQPEAMLPSTILIDEPELGLHPAAITVLAGLLRSAATQTQVIVSTQSVPLIDEFDPENIVVVEREDNQSIFRRLNSDALADWLEAYSLGELWQKNVLGGRP